MEPGSEPDGELQPKGALPFWFTAEWAETRRGATQREIDAAEAHLGRRLPAELRQLLLLQDGGVSNYVAYQVGDQYVPLLPFFGVGTDRGDCLSRAFDARHLDEIPEEVIVIAAMGHSWLGLRYRDAGAEPELVQQSDEDSPIEVVAPTFREFVAGLVEA